MTIFLTNLIDKGKAFVVLATRGDLFMCPEGYILRQQTVASTKALSWSAMRSDATEMKVVLSNCLSLGASFPSLAVGQFQQWVAMLHELVSAEAK